MSERGSKEQYCSQTLLQLKLMSGPLWAVFLWLKIKEVPSRDEACPCGYLPKEWSLFVMKPGSGPRMSINLSDLHAQEYNRELPLIYFEGLAGLRAETLQKPMLWNDTEETFLAGAATRQYFLLKMPTGPDMFATVGEGVGGGMYQMVERRAWQDVVPTEEFPTAAALQELIEAANQACTAFWAGEPELTEVEYKNGDGKVRDLSLVLHRDDKGSELVFRPLLADPTHGRDPCAQAWVAKKWALGWRPQGLGTEAIRGSESRPLPIAKKELAAVLQAASHRHEQRIELRRRQGLTLFDQPAWF